MGGYNHLSYDSDMVMFLSEVWMMTKWVKKALLYFKFLLISILQMEN